MDKDNIDILVSKSFSISQKELATLVYNRKATGVAALKDISIALNSSLENGLKDIDFKARREAFGINRINFRKAHGFFHFFLEALCDLTLIILMICAVLSILFGILEAFEIDNADPLAWIEGVSIIITILLVTFIGAGINYSKEVRLHKFKEISSKSNVEVIRNGEIQILDKVDLLVGDVILINYGDIVPADAILIESQSLFIDESILTGESDLVNKSVAVDPFVLSGTKVMEGCGRALVLAVGQNSQEGAILSLSSASDDHHEMEQNVLQKKLNNLAMNILSLALIVSISTFFVSSIFYIFDSEINKTKIVWMKIFKYLMLAVSILIVAIPEGLPLAVTLSLSFSLNKMLVENILVKHLSKVETMGSATTICSDKTGTLTTNQMRVSKGFIGRKEFFNIPEGLNSITKSALVECICLCSNSNSIIKEKELKGSKTECALLELVEAIGVNYSEIRENPIFQYPFGVKVFQFHSEKQRMSIIVPRGNGGFRLYTKGGGEIILRKCTQSLSFEGLISPISSEDRNILEKDCIDSYGVEALRTIALAFKDLDADIIDWNSIDQDDVESNLTLISIVGIENPLRDGVIESINKLDRAGVVVRMVTGDNLKTAIAIAIKSHILPIDDRGSFICMDGLEFRQKVLNVDGSINQTEFDKVWPRLRVLARCTPKDKYVLVSGIIHSKLHIVKNSGALSGSLDFDFVSSDQQVVAVTGDGTNDAPALAKADVSFAFKSGTEISKNVASLILTDDNFNSIVSALKWGRSVGDNISRFLQFQLTVNIVGIVLPIIAAFTWGESPLSVMQFLWINVCMDSFGSLALATEAPNYDILLRKPFGRNSTLISMRMLKNIMIAAMYQLPVLLFLYFEQNANPGLFMQYGTKTDSSGKKLFSQCDSYYTSNLYSSCVTRVHNTIIFNTFVLMQIINLINSRKIYDELNVFSGFFDNYVFLLIFFIISLFQIIIVNFGGLAFSVEPLTGMQWLLCVMLGLGMLPWGVLMHSIPSFPQSNEGDIVNEDDCKSKVSWQRKILYSLPLLPYYAIWTSQKLQLTRYFTDIIGIQMGEIAWAFVIARLFDVLVDPLVGYLSDNYEYQIMGLRGRRAPLMILGGVSSSLCFFCLFNPPSQMSLSYLIWWFLVFNILFNTLMSLFDTPFTSLGTELAINFHDRTSLYCYSSFFSYLGVAFGAVLLPFLLFSPKYNSNDETIVYAYFLYVSIISFLFIICVLIPVAFSGYQETIIFKNVSSFVPLVRRILRNGPFITLLYVYILLQSSLLVAATCFPYYIEVFIVNKTNIDETDIIVSYSLISLSFGACLGANVWVLSSSITGKRSAFILNCALSSILILLYLIFAREKGQIMLFSGFSFSLGFVASGLPALFYSMLADVIDYDMLYTLDRREAQFVTLATTLTKLLASPLSAVPLELMFLSGYVPNKSDQNESTEWIIKIFALIIPSLFMFICALLMLRYPITKQIHQEIIIGIKDVNEGKEILDPLTNEVIERNITKDDRERKKILDYFNEYELKEIALLKSTKKGNPKLHGRILFRCLLWTSLCVTCLLTSMIVETYFPEKKLFSLFPFFLSVLANCLLFPAIYEGLRLRTAYQFDKEAHKYFSSDQINEHINRVQREKASYSNRKRKVM